MTTLVKPNLVIDSDFQETVANYGSIISSVSQNDEVSNKLNELAASETSEEFYQQVLESVSILKGLPDKELESTLNLVFYFISEPLFESESTQEEESTFIARFQILLNQLYELSPSANPVFNDRVSIKFTSVLSVLCIFFNLIDEKSKLRLEILNTIVKIYGKLDQDSAKENLYLIKPLLKKSSVDSTKFVFEKYLVECQSSEDEIIKFTTALAKLIEPVYFNEALVILKLATIRYGAKASNSEVITNLAIQALKTPKEIDLSYFYQFDISKITHKTVLELLKLYTATKNNLKEFTSFVNDHKSEIESELSVSSKTLISKKEFLIIANLALTAAESNNYEATIESDNKEAVKKFSNIAPVLSYKQISDELNYQNDLVKIESLLINAVKLNIFQGKIDQIKQIFCIYKINLVIVLGEKDDDCSNKLGSKEWKFILGNLKNWKKSITEASDIIEQQKKKLSSH
ncbi:hypothetical protein DASC09_045280 [Saccharomycopsis crataegensis]|uniref:EIF3m n=1 Tax=Saccharomycopsis crataegensis TaxID=43959 RepID=A0AAV5QQK4_9ASCO|nr:hypothetical protein DASC09_045280 [Saccharomycopsis crataegensis]